MKTCLVLASLVVLALVLAAGISASANAASGTLSLAAWNSSTSSPDFVYAASEIKARSWSSSVIAVDGSGSYASWAPGKLAVDLSGVSFSGAQFDLYISSNGYSQISSNDVLWVKGVSVVDLGSALTERKYRSSAYPEGEVEAKVGLVGSKKLLVLPAPFYVPSTTVYVKLYDGGDVIVSSARLALLPSIKVSVSSAVAGQKVEVEGSAWPPNGEINVSMWYGGRIYATVVKRSDSRGWFKASLTAPDLGRITGQSSAAYRWPVIVEAFNGTDRNAAQAAGLLHSDSFYLVGRAFSYANTSRPDGEALDSSGTPSLWGSEQLVLDAMVGGLVYINGTGFKPGASVAVYWDYGTPRQKKARVVEGGVNGTGYLEVSFVVPPSSGGRHKIAVYDGSWTWNLTLNVKVSLLVHPQNPKPGSRVRVEGYAFTPSSEVDLFLYGVKADGVGDTVELGSATTDSIGSFSTELRLPDDLYGGVHYLAAGNSTHTCIASYKISVQPSIWVDEKNLTDGGGVLHVHVRGWPVGEETVYISCLGTSRNLGAEERKLTIAWDGMPTVVQNVTVADERGSVDLELTVAGGSGMHYVSVYDDKGRLVATLPMPIIGKAPSAEERIKELSARIATLKRAVSKLSKELSELSESLSEIRVGGNATAARIASLEARLELVEKRLSEVRLSLSKAELEASRLRESIKPLHSSLDELSSRMAGAESKIAELSEKLSSSEEAYSRLETLSKASIIISVIVLAIVVLLAVLLARRL